MPGKSDQHHKPDKKQDELIEGHVSKHKNVRFLQDPHHRYQYGDDKKQASYLVKSWDIIQTDILFDQP